MQYKKLTHKDCSELSHQDKIDLKLAIQEVLRSVSYADIDVNLRESALLILCHDDTRLSGFIDIIAEDESTPTAEQGRMYVNFIAVHQDYQHQHIAHNLYSMAVAELQKSGDDSLRAVLFNDFSRQAFESVASAHDLTITECSFDGSETIHLR